MYGVIKIGDQSVPMRSSAATQYRFKSVFGTDLMSVIAKAYKTEDSRIDIAELIPKLGFIMFRQAENEAHWGMLNEQSFLEWADQFDSTDMSNALPEILTIYNTNAKVTATPKNPGGGQHEK